MNCPVCENTELTINNTVSECTKCKTAWILDENFDVKIIILGTTKKDSDYAENKTDNSGSEV
jgi:hypothetical protein